MASIHCYRSRLYFTRIFGILFFNLCIFFTGCKLHRGSHLESLADALTGFKHPQDSARTKVWWFHGETATTREGITADLEAYKKAGVGGVIYYDQVHGKADSASDAFSGEWWKMLRFAAEEAERVGLTFELHISNGYVAGGPWITPDLAMKRLVATEQLVVGGKRFSDKLEAPENRFNFFRDVAVLAVPANGGVGMTSLIRLPRMSSNVAGINAVNTFNPKITALTKIPRSNTSTYLNLEFDKEFEARSITYILQPRGKATTSATNIPGPPSETFVGTGYRVLPDIGQLEASVDGITYHKICDLKPMYSAHENWRQKTVSFNAIKAKYYRLNIHNWWEENETQSLGIGSVVLNSSAKIDQWEEKAGLYSEYIEGDKTPAYAKEESIDAKSILDISNKLSLDGTLNWDAPPGNWLVLRFAYVPTGGSTKHGRANLLGLESDKLSAKAAEIHWKNYVGKIADSLTATNSGKVSGVAMDSHEAGSQNWTDNFIPEFKIRRGYDPLLYLPAMAGYVVNGVQESNGFLFDVRRNIADMVSDNYYGTFDSLARARGLTFTAQAIGNALCLVGDPIQAKSKVSKPQGEFWAIHPNGNYDIKESSSAAHLYNKKIASGEAFTDVTFGASLADIKSLADYAYAFGINEFVICASAYQPWLDKIPGNTGGGRQYAINRNNTWWNFSRSFWDFQARNAYIMRQGKSVADLCVYLGENAPVKILTYRLPDIPPGFDFDAFTTDALMKRMSASNGRILLPDGVSYKMMVLPRNGDITLDALRKITTIVKAGGVIYGPKPTSSSTRDLRGKAEYRKLADELWGTDAGIFCTKVGKGAVYQGRTLKEAIDAAGIVSDIVIRQGDIKSSMIYFSHRKLSDAHVFFLDNHKDVAENNVFTFNAYGKQVQLWNTVTGQRFSVPPRFNSDRTTSVRLSLAARESCFVVISQNQTSLPTKDPDNKNLSEEPITGAWNVYFDPKFGGPGSVTFPELRDWTGHSDPAIKYYSGTAVYKKRIFFEQTGSQVALDLGNPGSIARVVVNGQEAGTIWCSPWQLDISRYLRNGQNELEISVANSLMNRMIYDAQLPEKDRVTFAYPTVAKPNDKLVPSGLTKAVLIRRQN